jgi:hypothetical protein
LNEWKTPVAFLVDNAYYEEESSDEESDEELLDNERQRCERQRRRNIKQNYARFANEDDAKKSNQFYFPLTFGPREIAVETCTLESIH